MVDREQNFVPIDELGTEIPRDNRGFINWVILRTNPLKLALVIESAARSSLLISGEIVVTHKGLTKAGFSTIARAISRYYPGGYSSLRQKLNEHNELEVGQQSTISNSIALPNLRGKLRWTLSGNTPEQNKQLGISNIQRLFLKKFPEFDDLFPRDEFGKVTADKIDAAKDFILGKIDSKRKFGEVFTQSAHRRQYTPYFENSYFVALQQSFGPWGVDLQVSSQAQVENITDSPLVYDQRGRVRWSIEGDSIEDKTQRAIRNIQEIFLMKFPEFNVLFPRPENGLIDIAKRQEAASFILDKVGGYKKFQKIFCMTPLNKADVPLFEGNLITALTKAFGLWGLDFTSNAHYRKYRKPQHHKQKGYWSVSEHIEIEAQDFYNREGQLTTTLLRKRNRSDLAHAIRYYPGKMRTLKEKLGINSIAKGEEKVIVSQEDADEALGRLIKITL